MNTLLLTGTIQPQKNILFLNVTDPSTRYHQYIQNIARYICNSDAQAIVFCENSWYEITDIGILQWLAKIYGKKLEILQFNGDHEKSVKKGRWFWENEIIEYAIKHSQLIRESWSFIKITGRYRCENINSIIHTSEGKDICFSKLMPTSLAKLDTKAVNTAVFKTSVKFFEQHLSGAWEEVDDTKIFFLEHVYFKRLKGLAKRIHPLPEYPKMRGMTGQWTILKKSPIVERAMQLLHRIGITRI